MTSATSGRIVKARRTTKRTVTQKKHRWESFSNKIAKLHSLDPLRKVRRHDLDAEDLSTTTSYLRNGLEKWSDLNVTPSFVSFKREIMPLCDSLPQILHFEDKIMDILSSYIGKNEKEVLEPLLDLLTAFSHDLGVRFEKHYPKALGLIVSIAGKPQDVEVIEWTFAALAFLFKYLSRLLVSDLRPTYDALAPLLGKTRHPQYIGRFAAEALSFLVKKAAAPANREKALFPFIEHARNDLHDAVDSKQFELYYHGVMTMFAEAIKGSGQTIHSTGPDIFAALMRAVLDSELPYEDSATWADFCCGVLTSTIHHANMDTFRDLGECVVSEVYNALEAGSVPSWCKLFLYSRLFGVMSGVRKGSRVSNWAALIQTLSRVLDALSKPVVQNSTWDNLLVWRHVIINTAISWHAAPMDALLSSISNLLTSLSREPLMRWYIPFCVYLGELDPDRFRTLLQSHFQRFIVTHWSDGDNERILCVALPRMVSHHGLPAPGNKDACILPQSWQSQIVSKFERLEITPFPERGTYDKDPKVWRDECLPKYASLLEVLESTNVHPSTNARIAELLLRKIKLALRPSSSLATDESQFIVSQGIRAYLRMSKAAGSIDTGLCPLLRAAAPRFCRLPVFLQSILAFERELKEMKIQQYQHHSDSESLETEEDPFVKALVQNLSAPSHDVRSLSLQILSLLEEISDQHSCLDIMIQIEQTSLEVQNSRTISMQLRKLAQVFPLLDEGSWLQQAVPAFFFGMLTVRLAPVWDDAVEGLKQIAATKVGEEMVSALAFEWLNIPSPKWSGPSNPSLEHRHPSLTDFECLNLMHILKMSEEVTRIAQSAPGVMLENFEESQDLVPRQPDNARNKALKVLSVVPALAEKRSRKLVPHLFSWNEGRETTLEDLEEDLEGGTEDSWSLADRKALMGVFAQFTNPRVLFQSSKAYDTFLALMANGDVEVQKLALKAILSWKQEGVKPYQEHLVYLLDDARFKNEITILFLGDNKIRPEHRSEIMPILLRLLYGRTISKKGAASGRQGLHATRLLVLRHLDAADLGAFLSIAMGALRDVRIVGPSGVRESALADLVLPPRKQVGLLNMLDTVISEFGANVQPYATSLVNAILYCLVAACRRLRESPEDADDEELQEMTSNTSLYKAIRISALKSLDALFRNMLDFDWTPFKDVIVGEIISPRLDKLPTETTQGVSASLRLLFTWSKLPKSASFFSIDDRILPKLVDCWTIEKSKKEVKIFVMEIVQNLMDVVQAPAEFSEFNKLVKLEVLYPSLDTILYNIATLLRAGNDIDKDLLEACIQTIVKLSPIVERSENIQNLLDISTYLLKQPSRKVSPKVKGTILLILERFITVDDLKDDQDLRRKVFEVVSSLFGFFRDRENRETLCRIIQVHASQGTLSQEVADLCTGLNSYTEGKIEQSDYDRRLAAFTLINNREKPFIIDEWLPFLHNMVFYIRQDEEFGVLASSSADGICKFIDTARSTSGQPEHDEFLQQLSNVVIPAIQFGVKEASETIRREHLRVLGHLVLHMGSWAPVADLQSLATSSDDESEGSFFFNILSPAKSKQLQALHLLVRENTATEFSSKNISQIFVPLLEHFVFGREEGADDQGLGAQASAAIANLALSLDWAQYRVMLRRFASFLTSKEEQKQTPKQVIRLLEKVVDSFATACSQSGEKMDVDEVSELGMKRCRLSCTLPTTIKLGDEIVTVLLPPMLGRLHEKDETTVSARVPIAIIVVKLLHLLPEERANQKLPGVLTDVCHILRSKAWDAREMARDTLVSIASILGPSSFGFIIKELRGALAKGYQMHVLSYTVHSLLVSVIPQCTQGDLDYCLEPIVAVIMDDIFGATGQEKDAEEYVSQMKEVKSSKSQDSLELIAKTSSVTSLADLVQPLQALLLEKLDLRMVRRIDELLSRITSGLLQNAAAESQNTLVFCYEVIREAYKSQQSKTQQKIDPRVKRYLVQKGAKRSGERGATTNCTYKLVRFAIDIIRSIMRKYDSLRHEGTISGFLPMLGDAVVAGEEEVKIAVIKLLTVLIKVPFKAQEWTILYKVAAKESLKAISLSQSMGSDLAQTALKLVSVVLRDRPDVPVKEVAIEMVLGKLKDDLTEPLYRHVTFNFLRAVLDRKVQTAVVYDTLDYVGTLMITNDDKETRNLARGAFFQFIREFPQKKGRWAKQLQFIVANLEYDREGGRLSVMETIHLLLSRSANDFVQEVAATCFIPLVFRLANDDSEKCRLTAGELIKQLFKKADQDRVLQFLTLIKGWVQQEGNNAVLRLGFEAFSFYFEALDDETKSQQDLDLLLTKVARVVKDVTESSTDWELVKTTLQVVQRLLAKFPSVLLTAETQDLWAGVRACLLSSNGQVQLSATRLLGMYLADLARNGQRSKGTFIGSHGLKLQREDMMQLVRLVVGLLNDTDMEEALAREATGILSFLGSYAASKVPTSLTSADDPDEINSDESDSREAEHENDLGYLCWKLSLVLRRETPPRASALVPKIAAIDALETLSSNRSAEELLPSIKTIMRPLRTLTDPSIPMPFSMDELFKSRYEGLNTKAQLIMESLQKKLGTAEYTKALLAVGEEIKNRREQRSSKRKIEAVSHPEKFGREKKKRMEMKKHRKKAKGQESRSFRQNF